MSSSVVVSCRNRTDDTGFATPAAVMVSLALATVATATLLLTVQDLHLARSALRHSQVLYAIEGAQESAVVVLQSASGHRLSWSIKSPAGSVKVLAEPEGLKLSTHSAEKGMTDEVLRALGAADAELVRHKLADLPTEPAAAVDNLLEVQSQERWKSCIRSLVSPWGLAQTIKLGPTQPPNPQAGAPRVGEAWRIVSILDGTIQDRTIVITGDAHRPVVMLDRRPITQSKEIPDCDSLFVPQSSQ